MNFHSFVSGKFSSDLCRRIMTNLLKSSSENEWKIIILYLDVLRVLVLAKLAYVVNVKIVREYTANDCDIQPINLQEVPLEGDQEHFIDLQCYATENGDPKSLLVAMNSLIKEKPEVRWNELEWFIGM